MAVGLGSYSHDVIDLELRVSVWDALTLGVRAWTIASSPGAVLVSGLSVRGNATRRRPYPVAVGVEAKPSEWVNLVL